MPKGAMSKGGDAGGESHWFRCKCDYQWQGATQRAKDLAFRLHQPTKLHERRELFVEKQNLCAPTSASREHHWKDRSVGGGTEIATRARSVTSAQRITSGSTRRHDKCRRHLGNLGTGRSRRGDLATLEPPDTVLVFSSAQNLAQLKAPKSENAVLYC